MDIKKLDALLDAAVREGRRNWDGYYGSDTGFHMNELRLTQEYKALFVQNDAAVQIAEEAFRAGWRACLRRAIKVNKEVHGLKIDYTENSPGETDDWSAYEPSEAMKELTR